MRKMQHTANNGMAPLTKTIINIRKSDISIKKYKFYNKLLRMQEIQLFSEI